jgi:gluconokinase
MTAPFPRSPHAKVNGLVYFGRMLDKIRLHARGALPQDYIPNLGKEYDLRCVRLLGVEYAALCERTLQGGTDEEVFEWCCQSGRRPGEEELEVWNEFMRKRGWNDAASGRLQERLAQGGFQDRTDIQTIFDYIDLDEGRL